MPHRYPRCAYQSWDVYSSSSLSAESPCHPRSWDCVPLKKYKWYSFRNPIAHGMVTHLFEQTAPCAHNERRSAPSEERLVCPRRRLPWSDSGWPPATATRPCAPPVLRWSSAYWTCSSVQFHCEQCRSLALEECTPVRGNPFPSLCSWGHSWTLPAAPIASFASHWPVIPIPVLSQRLVSSGTVSVATAGRSCPPCSSRRSPGELHGHTDPWCGISWRCTTFLYWPCCVKNDCKF